MKKLDKPTAVLTGIIVLLSAVIIGMIYYGNQSTENTYPLSEINDGIYAIYYNTHSRVPAENYEVVTVCCNSNIHIFKGDVQISYVDTEPYIIVKQYNWVNSDKAHIYVPYGTVTYGESVNIGK